MKLKGQKLDARNREYMVFPRQGGDIVFVAEAIMDYSAFEEMCPRPTPPMRMHKGGALTAATDDPTYQNLLNEWATRHTDWMIISSLAGTPDFEFESVDISKPETYANWRKEFIEAGFTQAEIIRIMSGVMTANGLNQARIDEAQKSFLAGLEQERSVPPSPRIEQ